MVIATVKNNVEMLIRRLCIVSPQRRRGHREISGSYTLRSLRLCGEFYFFIKYRGLLSTLMENDRLRRVHLDHQ